MASYIYLASPYTHERMAVMESRYYLARVAAARLMQQGKVVFSPIAHSHPIADFMDERFRTDHEFWMKQSLAMLAKASKLVVLCIDGWDVSRGVTAEIQLAQKIGMPISYIGAEGNTIAEVGQLMEVEGL